jgi:hypothetical protein
MINIKPKLKFSLIFLGFFIILNIFFINQQSYQEKYFLNLSHEPIEITQDQFIRMYTDIQKYEYAESYFFGNKIKIYEGDIYKKNATLFSKTIQNFNEKEFVIILLCALLLIILLYIADTRIKNKI